jgi:hypothetical protein
MSFMSSSLKSIVPTPRERPLFVEVDLSHYTCPVCKDVFKDCVQLPCGHKCCNSCVDELFPPDSTEDGQCPVQEEESTSTNSGLSLGVGTIDFKLMKLITLNSLNV